MGLDAQKKAVIDYLNGGPWDLVWSFIAIESGGRADRPKLLRATEACKLYRAKLVIAKLDRRSRDAHFLLGLKKAGVAFVAADMPEANDMMVGLMALFAQQERKMISERTKVALAAAKVRGTKLGGDRGYRITAEARAVGHASNIARSDACAAQLAPVITELSAQGMTSLGALVRKLTERAIPTARRQATWTPMQVSRVLARTA